MKKIKYYYNPKNLRYEKYVESAWKKFRIVLGFLSAASVFAFIIVYLAYTYLDSPKEKKLKRELSQLQYQYDVLNDKLDEMGDALVDLQDRDDNIYRVIFEAEPIPSSMRDAGYGGSNRFEELNGYDDAELMKSSWLKLTQTRYKMYIQSKSYDALAKLIQNKTAMLSSIPAIQPVANKDLKRIGSGFGVRIDPIYKVPRMHEGIDFTAPIGTPIYATGNGTVSLVDYGSRDYGNHVILTHGYGYQTLYGHMSRVKVKIGQKVNRGDVIGYVGNSGKSTGPHCHYEVIKNGRKINPINFFYSDLTPEEFQQMLELAERNGQSLD
ncbi:peptidase M23 [Bacteroidota bacterium]|nr:peptidase M23 [Bacteroidota bacterium]